MPFPPRPDPTVCVDVVAAVVIVLVVTAVVEGWTGWTGDVWVSQESSCQCNAL